MKLQPAVSGDELSLVLAALSNPQRLRVIAALAAGRNYVSQLARELNISRPLLHIHLKKLEAAGLVEGSLELSGDGKATKYYTVTDFELTLTPRFIANKARSLQVHSTDRQQRKPKGRKKI